MMIGETTKAAIAPEASNHGRFLRTRRPGFKNDTECIDPSRNRRAATGPPFDARSIVETDLLGEKARFLAVLGNLDEVDVVDLQGPQSRDQRIRRNTCLDGIFVVRFRVNLLRLIRDEVFEKADGSSFVRRA